MFNKRFIAKIQLNHNKLLKKEGGSCEIATLDTKGLYIGLNFTLGIIRNLENLKYSIK